MEIESQEDLFACVTALVPRQSLNESEYQQLAAIAEAIGTRRAGLMGHSYSPEDLVYAYSLFCYWPFKPLPEPEYREFIAANLPRILESGLTPAQVADLLSDESLSLDFGRLFRGLEDGSLLTLIEMDFDGM